MPDANQGQVQKTEGETEEAMPTSQTQEVEVEAQASETEQTLPDGVSERTAKEFDKLKEHNKKLAEENKRLKQTEAPQEQQRQNFLNVNYPAPQQFGALSQSQVDNIASSFVDENGYVDIESLNKALQHANAQAMTAVEEARKAREEIERYNHTNEVKATYREFPELDPDNENFDETFYDMVENEIFGQLKKGKKENFLDAASKVSKLYNPRAKKEAQTQAATQEKQKSQTQRTQASTAIGQSSSKTTAQDQQDLIERTRKGDTDALYKRLQASGY